MKRRAAIAGAFLVALCGVGLWLLLGESPAPGSSARRVPSVKQGQPSVTPVARAAAEQAVPAPRAEVKPEGSLAVEVIAQGSPVPEAQVQVYWRESQEAPAPLRRWREVARGETDGNGHWEAPARPGSYFIAVRAQGFAPGTLGVVHPPGGTRTAVRLRLESAVGLLGHVVVRGTGDPVSFAEVLLTPLAFPPGERGHLDAPEEELLSTTSNEAGEFSFTGLAPGRYRAETRAPGFVRRVLPSVPVPFGARVTLDLVPGGRIEGTVVSADSQPVAGAEVLALSASHDATAFTDAQGVFSLELPPGTYSVSARHGLETGAREQAVTVSVEQVIRGLRLRLGAGARITGRVSWEDGTPALGARVEARVRGARIPSAEVGTDESGAFSLSSLAAGTYDVGVSMPQRGWFAHESLTLAAGEHATLTLIYKRQGSLSVRVQDMKARPLPGAEVKARALQDTGAAAGQVHEGRTDAHGTLRLTGLTPGPYQVEARLKPGAPSSEQTATVWESGLGYAVLQVPGPEDDPALASTVEGRVVQRSGAVPDAPVRIDVLIQGRNPVLVQNVATDAQGRFRLTLSPGSYTLTAWSQHRLRCGADGQLQLQLEAARPTEATLVLEEPRAPTLRIRLHEAQGVPSRLTPVTVHSLGAVDSRQTDASGGLALCIAPQLLAGAPMLIQALEPRRAALVMQAGTQPELTVQLRPLPTLRGKVIHPSGAPVKRFHLELRSQDFPLKPLAHDFVGDQFELREVPLGRSQLLATVDDGRRALVTIDMSSGVDMRLELPLHSGVPLTGRIVDATTGAPVAHVEVSLPLFAHTRTTRDGRFIIRDLPAGEHVLKISRGSVTMSQFVTLAPEHGYDMGDIALAPP